MNLIDEFIGFLNPKAGYKRAQARAAMEMVRSFDAAAKSRRTEDWRATSTSANSEIRPAIGLLRDRAREMDRNNPYAKKAINVIASNTVGAGIRISIKANEPSRKKVLEVWNEFADYITCDFDGRFNFYGLQKLVMRSVALSGEALIIKERLKFKDGQVPIQLRVIEGDYIDLSKDQTNTNNGGKIVQGIEFDKKGKRVAYWIYTGHPGDQDLTELTSQRVSANDVIHIYLKDRPGQERGVPFGTASMVLLKDFKDYQDAELLRQKIASCFALFVQDDNADGLGSGSSTTTASDMVERVEPGIIEHLPAGKSITFAKPPTTSGYGEHTKRLLQAIAAGYGITYEALTGDMSMVNFSSGRMGWLEFHRQVTDWQLNMMIPQMCDGVFAWFCDAAKLAGLIPKVIRTEWTAPRREMIDPVKEINGLKEAVRNGFISYQEAVRELGYDPDNLMEELKADMDKLKALGLVLDCDARNDIPVPAAPKVA